jgi:hypothetical protein
MIQSFVIGTVQFMRFFLAKKYQVLVIIKHPASDINDHEKSGPAGCT